MTSAPHHPHDSRKVSDVLAAIARNTPGDRVRLRDLVSALEDRAFGLLILVFSLPNIVGMGAIPGVSTIFGVPQIFIAMQMMLGFERPWLPDWVLDKSLSRQDFATMIDKSKPHFERVERVLRPRWAFMSSYLAERILGAVMVVMAVIVSLPIPLGNWPPAAAMGLISLGVIERDGLFVAGGVVISVAALAIALAVVIGGAAAIWLVFTQIFGA